MNAWRDTLFARHPWLPLVGPLAVFMIAGSLLETTSNDAPTWLGLTAADYPWAYAVRIALTLAMIAFVWPGIRTIPMRVSPLSVIVGLIGGGVWIGLWTLNWEKPAFEAIGLEKWFEMGKRQGFDPLATFREDAAKLYGFLGVRFVGLVLVVPLIEELFLRAFVMRFVVDARWWEVPLATMTRASVAAGLIVPLLMHPGRETFAALVWFGMMLGWFAWRKSLWDCIVAHAVTNLMIGVAVLYDPNEFSGLW